ncbi:MAG: type I 3-dehydroquinate dehydratase [Planctomycetes bacterium]|nr:type I 3-dehydroquinate dehydratase [Planctomycetota bacterium]
MIVATIPGPTAEDALAQIESARMMGADAAEVRLDLLASPDPAPFLTRRTLPWIVTVRPAWEGGRWSRSEDDRIALLREASRGGADWVDVEFKAYKDFDRGHARLLLSYHDFEKVPDRLDAIARKMEALDADAVKIAFAARSTADLLVAVRLQKRMRGPSVVVAMGEWGEPLRILYARYGAALTYASAGRGAETAEGQLTVAELVRDYRVKAIDGGTQVFAVVGDPVVQAKSPKFFNPSFRELGLNARCVPVRLDDAARLREAIDVLELRGVCVTAPHKEAVVSQMDAVDALSGPIGAVNTVLVKDGHLEGSNTDAAGAMEAIRGAAMRKWRHGVYGMRALVLGAGGMARAAAWSLRQEGARVTIANRTFDRAKAVAEALRCDYLAWDRLGEGRFHVVVNATTVGMGTDESPLPPSFWSRDMVAFDAVHTPRVTRFLREAAAAGAEVADGVEAFVRQASRQLQIFTGRSVPTEVLKEFTRTL